jgi:rare lipoprotein A (peptidoglycan hydrolase)
MMAALALTSLLALFTLGPATPAGAHGNIARWWQFDPLVWHQGWHHSKPLEAQYSRWQRNHPRAGNYRRHEFSHVLRHRWRMQHFHQAHSHQAGLATWYDQTGSVGGCGVPLRGMYAASRTLPCGSLVSVRHGDRYVFVRILDRGPFGSASRILDLSPRAFRLLAPLGSGVISVRSVRLKPRP